MQELDRRIIELLEHPIYADALSKAMPEVPRRALAQTLARLTQEGVIMRSKKNKYGRVQSFGCMIGTFLATERAFSFVAPETGGADVFIPPHAAGGAWQGDRVLVQVREDARNKNRQEGTVIRIISRSEKEIRGMLKKRGNSYYLQPMHAKYPPISILHGQLAGAQVNQQISVRIVFWGDGKKRLPAQAVVTAVLGESGSMQAAIAGILHENGVLDTFPADVLAQAQDYGQQVVADELYHREDLRALDIFTIDGDDAKDFDDAISLQTLDNGHYLLGVHIADVSHYVTPNSPLDLEAYKRGTSVYFPAHVVPMLPFALSNGICSLNPAVDRLTFSAFIELDAQGGRHHARFAKSIICSKARMTYGNVNAILSGDTALRQSYAPLVPTFEALHTLTQVLRRRRIEQGALDLDIPEAQVQTDAHGAVVGIINRPRGDSEKLIEECMLLANEAVAQYLCTQEFPTVYRVHENPDPEKLQHFAQFAKNFGYRVDASTPENTVQLQTVLRGAAGNPAQKILPTMLLRSLARARYSDECLGHYGLQAKFYLHFTSPIRRYPDLVTHRMLAKAIAKQAATKTDTAFCAQAAVQSTQREQAADNCERGITKLYLADYMAQFVGQEFDGTVAGVTAFGVFVELPNTVEGLLRIEEIPGYWEFEDKHLALTGKNGARITIGQTLHVRLAGASNITGQIDFVWCDNKA